MILFLLLLAGLSITAAVAALREVANDGYHRVATCREAVARLR